MKGLRNLLIAAWIALAVLLCPLAARQAMAGPSDGLPALATPIDGATPRRSFDGFLQAARAKDFVRAAHYLDLRGIARGSQSREGPTLAQELAYVIERELPLDSSRLSDAAEMDTPQVPVGTVVVDEEPILISLTRVRFDDGVQRWVISRTTTAMIPTLYAAHAPRGWEQRLPSILTRVRFYGIEAWQWLGLFVALVVAWLLGRIFQRLALGVARRLARRTQTPWDDELVEAARGPSALVAAVVALRFLADPLHFAAGIERVAQLVGFTVLVVGIAWFVTRAVDVFAEWVVARLPDGAKDDTHSRSVRTQLGVLQRLSSIVTVVVGSAVVLIQFDFVRSVGLSLLASAGVVGIVFGVAAQKSLSGVIAGIQLSITQQLRIGDTIVTEGEFGTVEEINLTYVVVKIWDERRMVVPIARFLDQSFQNWTRTSSEVQGAIMIQADYALPVEKVREELTRICTESASWDKRQSSLKVVDVTDRCLTLRALVSARDADALWSLRCEVREKLMKFLRELDGGRYLVRLRSANVSAEP